MPKRNYSSTAVATTLDSSGLAADITATSCTVLSTSGFPSIPFTLVLSPDTLNEEIVNVTGRSGNLLTIERNQENSGLHEHAALAPVKHMVTGRDLAEPQDHMFTATGDRVSGVHGVTSAIVGISDSQVLTNKTLSGALNTFVTNTIPQGAIVNLVTDLSNKAPLTNPSLSGASLSGTTTLSGTVNASGATAVTLPAATTIGNVSNTELGFLDGVTSAVQTQLNAKAVYPDQSGNAGKFLTTNGSTTSWAAVTTGGGGTGTVTSITAGTGLTANGVAGATITTSGTLAVDTTSVVTTSNTVTMTNKTLTSPTINSPLVTGLALNDSSIVFEGSSVDGAETTLTVTNPTQDRTITLPDATGTVFVGQSGTASGLHAGSTASNFSGTVTFPTAFTVEPKVFANISFSGTIGVNPSVWNINVSPTTTGFTYYILHVAASSVTISDGIDIQWMAIP